MQFLSVVIILLTAFTINNCHENDTTSVSTSQSETNHRRPLFPRISVKFVVDSQKGLKKSNNDQVITTKKPLMAKIVPKTKIEVNIRNRLAITRKPLMQKRNFTVNAITYRRLFKNNDTQNSPKKNFEANVNNSVKKNNWSDLRPKGKKILITARPRARNNKLHNIVESTTVNYFAEEHKDRKEFIFLDSKNDEKEAVHDILQMDERDLETTTVKVDETENLRTKRNVNIIEEENRVTATPSPKYIGHDVKINNDRFFKNVNT